jgi:TolB-like protein/predicted Zn-dependent protease
MGGSVNGIRAWLSELRRRGVFHVTGLYAVGAWAVVQVIDAISGPFPLPEAALRLIWFAALLGFPVALVFGWRYDVTKHGIVRTHRRLSHGEDVPITRADYGFIGALALVMAGIVGMTTVGVLDAIEEAKLRAAFGPEIIEPQANSIAVLPFGVCDGHEADEALAEGLAIEVINQLASQRLLKVIARTSAFNIASFDIPLLEMGQRLGVTHLLTGTVCREGGPLTVTVELLDEKGFVAWSETLRQEVGSSGLVQVTLAGGVVQGVAGALGHEVTMARAVPVDPKAYEHYLIGEKFLQAGDGERAKAEYEKALAIQPEYPEALHGISYAVLEEPRREDIEARLPYLERAKALAESQVESGQADFRSHLTLGRVLFSLARTDQELAWRNAQELGDEGVEELKARATDRLTESEHHLRKALALNPANIEIYSWLAANLDWQGIDRGGEALEIMESALDIEPLNESFSIQVANRLAARGRYREGIELLERFEELPDAPWNIYWAQLEIMSNRGATADQFEKLVELLHDKPDVFDSLVQGYFWWLPQRLEGLGMPQEAALWYERVQRLPLPEEHWKAVLRRGGEANYLLAIGRTEEAIQLWLPEDMPDDQILDGWYVEVAGRIGAIELSGDFERAIRLQEAQRHRQESAFWVERQAGGSLVLADLYLTVGREEDARRELEGAAAEAEAQVQAGIRHPGTFGSLAEAYAGLGRYDEAIEMGEKAVDNGGWGAVDLLDPERVSPLDTVWQRFKDDPRFLAIVDRSRARRDQQVQRIRAITARNDIDALLEPLFAKARAQASQEVAAAEEAD